MLEFIAADLSSPALTTLSINHTCTHTHTHTRERRQTQTQTFINSFYSHSLERRSCEGGCEWAHSLPCCCGWSFHLFHHFSVRLEKKKQKKHTRNTNKRLSRVKVKAHNYLQLSNIMQNGHFQTNFNVHLNIVGICWLFSFSDIKIS